MSTSIPPPKTFSALAADARTVESLLRLVDDEPELREILSRVAATGDHYANEMRLAPTEVHADERTVDCRVSPIDLTALRCWLR